MQYFSCKIFILNFSLNSKIQRIQHPPRATLKINSSIHQRPRLTALLKTHLKPQTYHPSHDDKTHPTMFLPRKIHPWHQTDPMMIKVSTAGWISLLQYLILLIEESLTLENEKENDSRSGQATQAVIQRRRRPKRRSTGVVHVDMDVSLTNLNRHHYSNCFVSINQDIDPDNRQESPVDNGEDKDVVSKNSERNCVKIDCASVKQQRLIRSCNRKNPSLT